MKHLISILIIFFYTHVNSCVAAPINEEVVPMSEKLYQIPENCDFTAIKNNNSENDCTPKLLSRNSSIFTGILINGPKEVTWPKDASLTDYPPNHIGQTKGPLRLMIAGLMRAKYTTMGLRGQFSYEILIVAINQKTAQTYSGKMPRGDFEPWPKPDAAKLALTPKREDFEEYRESLSNSKFNLDLVHDLNLPISDATYTVYATLGEYKSNVLIIKTKVK
jgi:hypothetical protein